MAVVVMLAVLSVCVVLHVAHSADAMSSPPHVSRPMDTVDGGGVTGHRCEHDNTDIVAQLYYHGMDHSAPQRMQGRTFQTASVNGIRIAISTLDVYDSSKVCTAVGQNISNLQGSTVTCTQDDILTDVKREILLNKVLPQAIAMHAQRLKVNSLTSNLVVGSTSSCPYFTIPSSHTTVGVPDADFVLYVAAAKTSGGTIAWAGFCELDGATFRPLVGRVNFGPKYLVNTTAATLDQVVRVGVHEINHALGFSFYYVNNFKPSILTNVTVRGKNVYAINGTASVAAARNFFGCQSLAAVELEDEGGPGTATSHWERRNHYEDVMSGIVGTFMWYTNVTLGFLYDLGVYFPDFTLAETPIYGKNEGCSLLTTTCVSTANPALGWLFCNDTTSTMLNCSYDHVGYGYCYVRTYSQDLRSYFQYFNGQPRLGGVPDIVDYCPLVLPGLTCTDASAGTNNAIFGTHYGSGSRCMTTNNLIQNGFTATTPFSPVSCVQMRCVDGVRLQFALGTSGWTDCPVDGSAGTVAAPSGYKGSLVCPKAFHVCRGDDIMFSTTTSTATPPTTTATPATTTTASPTTTTASPATTTTASPATTTASPATTTASPATTTTATPAATTTASPATTTTASPATTTASPATTTTASPATTTTASPATTTTASPATTTASPATTTSAPAASQIVLRLSGTKWGIALASNRSGTEAVVRSSIADALNVDLSAVELVSVTEGSLVVLFNVVSTAPSSSIVSAISTASFSSVETFYQTVASTTETVGVASVDANSSASTAEGAFECSSACVALAILGSVVGAVVVVGFSVWWCHSYNRMQKTATQQHNDRIAPTSAASVVVDVYQERDGADNPAHQNGVQPLAHARHHLYNIGSPPRHVRQEQFRRV